MVGHCEMSSNKIEISFENFEKTRKEWYQSTQQKVLNMNMWLKLTKTSKIKMEKKTPPVWIIRLLMLSKSCNKQIRKKS